MKYTAPKIELDAVVLDCSDVGALSDFYAKLLGWTNTYSEGDEWVELSSPAGGTKIAFQQNELYIPPTWPETPNEQQQMAHLDFKVGTGQYALAVQHALACGAAKADTQYSDRWTVLLDPEGHPFCIVAYENE